MAVDKHSQDAVAKLYAEWISAGVKLSVAGFAATTKIMEAATQSMVSSRAKAHASDTAKAAPPAAKPEARAPLKVVPTVAEPAKAEGKKADVAATPAVKPVAAQVEAPKPATSATQPSAPAAVNDLKLISGIGPKLEQMLVRKGITSFAQIAALSGDQASKLDADLNLNGRIQRDDWVGQASRLAGA